MFTYEWLGMPSESGIPRVLDSSTTAATDLEAAIAHAKSVLASKIVFPAGEPYGVRILNSDSVLVWTGSADNT